MTTGAPRTLRTIAFLLAAAASSIGGEALAATCATSAECIATPGTPICDPQAHVCVACLVDFKPTVPPPLSCPTAQKPACQRSGILLGQCTECSSTNATACTTGGKPVCNTAKGECGCVSDGDCGARSGLICDPGTGAGQCVPGCRVIGGVDSCPIGQSCSAQDGGTGMCVATTCTRDGDCKPPAPKCDLQNPPGRCVECTLDTDCKGGLVCDTGRGQCVECAPGKTGNCTLPKTCLPNDTCGCVTALQCATDDGGVGDGGGRDGGGGDGGGGDGGIGGGDGGASGADGGLGGAPPDDTILEGGGCSCRLGAGGQGGTASVFGVLGLAGLLARGRAGKRARAARAKGGSR